MRCSKRCCESLLIENHFESAVPIPHIFRDDGRWKVAPVIATISRPGRHRLAEELNHRAEEFAQQLNLKEMH